MSSECQKWGVSVEDYVNNVSFFFLLRICVNQKHICDGYDDCPGAEDELNCPKPRQCGSNSKCEQLCVVSTKGQDECACRLGYTLHSNGYRWVGFRFSRKCF